jgi:uncharacterized lipoprotein YmbA
MIKVRPVWRFVAGVVVITLSACHSAPTRIYGIDATAPATHIDTYDAPALRIDTLNVPANWDRIEILTFSAGKLQISDFDHWSAPLVRIARQALSEDLDRRLPPGSVIYPRLPKTDGALGVNVDILEFNVVGLQASMHASWLIVSAVGSNSAKRSEASLSGPTTSSEPAAIAHAWSDLIGQLADRIAADAASFATR